MTFCLVDGSILSAPYDAHETLRIPAPRSTDPAPTEILTPTPRPPDVSPPLSTIQSPQPTPFYPAKQQAPLRERQSRKPWVAIFIGISVLLILAVGGILGFIWFGTDRAADAQPETRVPNTNVGITATPTATPTATIADGGWEPRNDHASLTGENLTYYPGTTPEQCQEDCDKNKRCKGYTFIRAGAYNPGDAAMCYQASVVKEMVSHPCCISAVKR
ncbi:MAG TPA: PAN domain-containing protein [Pyrinomonadaceae bacterium]